MHIGILGCRGIPNRYGGFEQFATYLSEELSRRGIQVTVYCSHTHPDRDKEFHGVQRILKYDPESWLGNVGQIWYDLLCILDARKRNYSMIYQLGYTSCGLWQWLLPTGPKVVSNMDGLEWTRAKYGTFAKAFLRWSEKKVAERSDWLIADALPIQEYLKKEFQKNAIYLAYATPPVTDADPSVLDQWHILPGKYMLLIARMQPDNHIVEAIEGVLDANLNIPLLIVGDTSSKYGKALVSRYTGSGIRFLGGIFEKPVLDVLRTYSLWYFHGHSAGGTNPSLLEAMAASSRILAHDNPFNRSVLKENGVFFRNSSQITRYLQDPESESIWNVRIEMNKKLISTEYNLDHLARKYEDFFRNILSDAQGN